MEKMHKQEHGTQLEILSVITFKFFQVHNAEAIVDDNAVTSLTNRQTAQYQELVGTALI